MNEQAFINGFLKRAADYGVSENEAIEILKKADHPFKQEQAARVRALDEFIAATKYNRQNHLGHYLFNPFVGGPLTEGLSRLGRRMTAGRYHHPTTAALDVVTSPVPVSAFMGGQENRQSARDFMPEGYEEILNQVSKE
jgi:hypothetical protein